MSTRTEQVTQSSTGISDRAPHTDVACCPKCSSTIISRVKRSFFQKITSRHMRFHCHDCHTLFWRKD